MIYGCLYAMLLIAARFNCTIDHGRWNYTVGLPRSSVCGDFFGMLGELRVMQNCLSQTIFMTIDNLIIAGAEKEGWFFGGRGHSRMVS